MGNASIKPQHTATESTIVLDSHPCAVQAARRAFDGYPQACTAREYSDIFATASEALAYPIYCGCCCGPPFPRHQSVLSKLRQEHPSLKFSIQDRFVGGRWQFVLVIKAKERQIFERPPQQQFASPTVQVVRDQEIPTPSSNYPSSPTFQVMSPSAPPAALDPHNTQISIVQGIPINERK